VAPRRRAREGLGDLRPSLADVAARKFDVIVIGGGINGTAIAFEAQRRGYRTLLAERHDFGAGPTSRATRLIHGGLRYLEHAELALVYESLQERETLLREMPHLVRPLRMLIPVYSGDERPPWKVRAGLALYDALSLRKSLPRNRAVPRSSITSQAPGLNTDGLRAIYAMYDGQVEFPERIVIETLRAFVDAGGVAMNHTAASGIVSPGGTIRALTLRDACSGETVDVGTSVIINAAGPWADEVLQGSDAERHERLIGGTKGSHLVVDWPGGTQQAIFASAKADGRPFFILPWYRYTLVGTTDIRYDGDPSQARCTADELRYLLDEATRLFPSTPLRREHVLYTYSGVRPLPYTPKGDESTITRSHFVIDHVKRGGPAGLLSIVGGKLTTYRSLARSAAAAIAKRTAPSGVPRPAAEQARPLQPRTTDALSMYGGAASEVSALIERDSALSAPICRHNPEVMAQAVHAVERECAATLADVLLRRLPIGWSACHGVDGAEAVARAIAPRLGWSSDRMAREVAAYEQEVAETLVAVEAIQD
jgi:glycerol-3-phosphate dehydrogenase